MDNVLCTGRETRLQDCTHSRDASEDFHYEDAGVRCFQPGECVTGDLRLAGLGNGLTQGRVEVCVGGRKRRRVKKKLSMNAKSRKDNYMHVNFKMYSS